MKDALSIANLQSSVGEFARSFLSNVIADEPVHASLPSTPTASELRRFERALYRFEIYRNLFRQPRNRRERGIGTEFQKRVFFDRFPPWKNEQLGCIHDLLFGPFLLVSQFTVPPAATAYIC